MCVRVVHYVLHVCKQVNGSLCVVLHGAGKLACSSCSQIVPVTVKPVCERDEHGAL